MNSKFRITLDTSIIPQKGKSYLIKVISEKLENGKPDKLYGGGNYLAKFNGKFFLIGGLKRRRSIQQVEIITEAAVDKGRL